MGLAGFFDFLHGATWAVKNPKKMKIMRTVALKVRMDCEGCARKINKILSSMNGVKSVEVHLNQEKATVTGYIEPHEVLKRLRKTKKKVEIWPYVPYNVVTCPYIAQSYDKKAPPGYVRFVDGSSIAFDKETRVDEHYATMFSDDNPNACSVM